MKDLISVVIPVYNVEEYLERCIKSVVNQTYHNLEIILVNDGSTDNSGKISDKLSVLDKRIVVIHKKNGGLSSARNEGIAVARGSYITFIDSDDWVSLNYIEVLYRLVKENKAEISVCNFEKIASENTKITAQKNNIYIYNNIEALEALTSKHYIQMVTSWGALYKIDLFQNVKFKEGAIHEDEFISHHLYYAAETTVLTTEKLLYYWQREDSITGIGFEKRNKLFTVDALVERIEFLGEVGLDEIKKNVYKPLFLTYIQLFYYEQNKIEKDLFKLKLKKLEPELNNGKYDVKFTIAYKLYYIAPTLISRIIANKI